MVRGNADYPWRAPHRSAGSDALIRSAGADVDYAPLGAPPPLIYLEAAFVQWLARLGRNKKAPRECFSASSLPGVGLLPHNRLLKPPKLKS
jgi:hypothetical protein